MAMPGENPQPARCFPQDRVQTLLRTSSLTDVNQDVQVEGSFIQLTDDGLPFRQVFLAITKDDFIIVKQDTNVDMEVIYATNDVEYSDLEFDDIIPLPILHFFILDDRAKRFTVCTSFGLLYHFEMCLLDFNSEQLWSKWRTVIAKLTGMDSVSFDAQSMKSTFVAQIDEKIHKEFEAVRNLHGAPCMETLHFLHHATTFKRVDDIGVQTDNGDSPCLKAHKKKTKATNKRNNWDFIKYKRNHPISFSSSSEDSVESCDAQMANIVRPTKTRDVMLRDRLAFLYTGNEKWRQQFTVCMMQLSVSRSMEDFTATGKKSDRKTTNTIDLSIPKKLQNFRDRFGTVMDHTSGDSISRVCIVGDMDSVSESEEDDLDKAFSEIGAKNKRQKNKLRTGRFLWSIAKCLVLKKGDKPQLNPTLANVFSETTFKKLNTSHMVLPPSITDLPPLDVSNHLAYASRRLFLLVTTEDIEIISLSNGRKIPKSVCAVLQYNDVIVRTVVTETLLNTDGMRGKLRAIRFFVQVATNLLFHHNDFQSLTAILKGLTSLPLYHMDTMWANLFVQEPFTFCQFISMVRLLSPENQYGAYVNRVATCIRRQVPFIPWMDHIFMHCISRKMEDDVQTSHFQPFGKVLMKIRQFENKSKPHKRDSNKRGSKKHSKSILAKKTSSTRWSFRNSKNNQKSSHHVRFDTHGDDDNALTSSHSEEMKRKAKAMWVKKTVSVDDVDQDAGDNTETLNPEQTTDGTSAVSIVISDYSSDMSNSILNEAVSEASGKNLEDNTTPTARLCHMIKRRGLKGYGFSIFKRMKGGKYIGDVEADSPAEEVGLKRNDKIIEVNGRNVEKISFELVSKAIQRSKDEIKLLVVDKDAWVRYKKKRATISSSMPDVRVLKSTVPEPNASDKWKMKSKFIGKLLSSTKSPEPAAVAEEDNASNKWKKKSSLIGKLFGKSQEPVKLANEESASDKWKKKSNLVGKLVNKTPEPVENTKHVTIVDDNLKTEPNNKTSNNGSNKETEDKETEKLEPTRRMSYAPSKDPPGRRKSLFEEAIETHATEEEENQAFEALKASRSSGKYDRRKSGIELLSVDDDDMDSPASRCRKQSIVETIGGVFGHETNEDTKPVHAKKRTDNKQKENNNQRSKQLKHTNRTSKNCKNGTNTNQNSKEAPTAHKVTRSVSEDRINNMNEIIDTHSCMFCAGKSCIYSDRVSTQVEKFQSKLLEMKTHSRGRVKEYLQLVADVYDCRSDWEILQLSFESEYDDDESS